MDLFHLINSSEGPGNEDIDLDVLDGFGAFIGYLSAKIFRLPLVAYLLQHLPQHLGETFQLPIHHCRICEHSDMEDEFLMALILLLTPWRYSLSHVLRQHHHWSDEE
jgi:hypothetical protein